MLFERKQELAAAEQALDEAAAGHGALLAFRGPAGIGKSSLLAATRTAAEQRGMTVLSGSGSEPERSFPFAIARQLFEPVVAATSGKERVKLFAGAAAPAEALIGEGQAQIVAGDPIYAALRGLFWLTATIAEDSPVLIAVDDVHWADPPSLQMLGYLAKRLDGLKVLVAIAARESRPPTESEELGFLTESAQLVDVGPLTPEASGMLVGEVLDQEPAPEFAAACHEATSGNPHLLKELAVSLGAAWIEPTAENVGEVSTLNPASISYAVLARLGRLGEGPTSLAKAVSIAGAGSQLRDAAALAGLSEQEARGAADTLVDAQILGAERALDFVHPIIRTAIYADIPPQERAAGHVEVARRIAERGGDPAAVATHLLSTDPRGDPWVVARLREAAEIARDQGAPVIAADFLERALEEAPSDHERAEILLELGAAASRAGRADALVLLGKALELASESEVQAAVALELGPALTYAGRAAEAVKVLGDAIEELEAVDGLEGHGLELLTVLEGLLLVTGATITSAHRLTQARFQAAEARASELPDHLASLILAPLALERAVSGGAAADAAAFADRALAGGRLLQGQTADSPLPYVAVGALLCSDHLQAAERALDVAIEDTRARSSGRGFALASACRSLTRYRRGALDEAEADARSCLGVDASIGWEVFRMIAAAALAASLVEKGKLDEASEALDSVASLPHDPDAVLTQPMRESRARLLLARGDGAAALTEALSCARREESWGARSVAPIAWRSLAAQAHHALGQRDEAYQLAEEELEIAREFGSARATGIALRVLGTIEGAEQGELRLREAVTVLEGSEGRLEHSRAMVDLGAHLRRSGSRSAARTPLQTGLELARECGASALVDRAYEELKATGARPRKILQTGVEALTASERRVAMMAAEGMTNQGIAQALFVTPKTVEVHLTHTYQKLDISSRRDLATELDSAAHD